MSSKLLLAASAASSASAPQPFERDLVVLTHGIASSKWFLAPLASRLRGDGFDTVLYGYFTLAGSIQQIGERFADRLHVLADKYPGRTIHVVAHSMGSIVTRCALLKGTPERLGRIVMVGPPNRGSHVARRLTPLGGRIWRTLAELSDVPDSFVNGLPRELRREVGIVTAGRDAMVPQGSTLLDDHTDHITLDSRHTSILWRERTARHIAQFLQSGRFSPQIA